MNRNKVSEIVTQVQALLEPLDDTTALEALRQITETLLDQTFYSVARDLFIRSTLKAMAGRL